MKGVGPFTHTNPKDRPPMIFGGKNTLHFGGQFQPYLLAAGHSEIRMMLRSSEYATLPRAAR